MQSLNPDVEINRGTRIGLNFTASSPLAWIMILTLMGMMTIFIFTFVFCSYFIFWHAAKE
jgi:hypothetical protein